MIYVNIIRTQFIRLWVPYLAVGCSSKSSLTCRNKKILLTAIIYSIYIYSCTSHQLLLLLLLFKKVGSARLIESDIHPISPKTPAPQYRPIDRKKRKEKRVEDNSRDRAAQANKKALALLLKPASPTPSNTGQQDSSRGTPRGE